METVAEKEKKKICVAIIGNPNSSIATTVKSSTFFFENVHYIPFVEAKFRVEWTEWLERSKSSQVGIGSGSAGCLLAHRDSWKTFQNCDHQTLLVLEDDAIFTKYGLRYFSSICNYFHKSDLLLLHLGDHENFSFKKLISLVKGFDTRKLLKLVYEKVYLKAFRPQIARNRFPYSGHAYLIDSELAKLMFSNPPNFMYPIDVHLNSVSQVQKNRVAEVRTPILIQGNNRVSFIKQRGR